ncbi:NINE protein [Rudanella lutea]|uniref:NINE protein n=1 Tax=Rudanella lutea TaxID=451374 RepID=UPI0003A48ED4|nr:TM2 domain-containing protein [Rudanella lutea]
MKKLFLFLMLTVASMSAFAADASVEAYMVDDQQVEQLIAQSEDISLSVVQNDMLQNQSAMTAMTAAPAQVKANKEFVPALLLNLFLGGLGIHRLYLGTKPLTWIGYILTCGGIFGVVPLVDLIVLIINNDNLSPYIDNPKFFMWAK